MPVLSLKKKKKEQLRKLHILTCESVWEWGNFLMNCCTWSSHLACALDGKAERRRANQTFRFHLVEKNLKNLVVFFDAVQSWRLNHSIYLKIMTLTLFSANNFWGASQQMISHPSGFHNYWQVVLTCKLTRCIQGSQPDLVPVFYRGLKSGPRQIVSWISPHEQYTRAKLFSEFFSSSYFGIFGHWSFPLGGILSLFKIGQRWCSVSQRHQSLYQHWGQ